MMLAKNNSSFHEKIKHELDLFLSQSKVQFPPEETLRIDLHCHDFNSNVPDEQLGRIMNIPETWLSTDRQIHSLKKNGMDVITITNHNNARSCFDLLDKGSDVLVGAEFSVTVPDFETGIHVLTYGFSPKQEEQLYKLRINLYSFLEYTSTNDLPTVWAHPLYHYKSNGTPPMAFFNKMALCFERFEVLNGQRDTWQNLLIMNWVKSLTEEQLLLYSKLTGLNPGEFCRNPFKKSMTGGSDSHMGIFSGLTGTYLYVPDLEQKMNTVPMSDLALQALKDGNSSPFGGHNNSEKMMVTFLDYFCQIALNSKDPGLLRIILHKGGTREKMVALLVSNGFAELRQHKITMKFIDLFHNSLTGIKPRLSKRWLIPMVYKPIFDQARKMAITIQNDPKAAAEMFNDSIQHINKMLQSILSERILIKIEELKKQNHFNEFDINKFISHLELPSELRSYLGVSKLNGAYRNNGFKPSEVSRFLNGLSFPFLASSIILSAHFASTRVMYNSRPLLNEFSQKMNYLVHPKRMLWLTDTWDDNNGVSTVLKSILQEIRSRDLPVDLLICSNSLRSEDHLVVVKPAFMLNVPLYKDLSLAVPNYLDIHHLFLNGEYDRVMTSTEGPMGLAALYLKYTYTIPAFLYVHTDWITFSKKNLVLEKENQSRFRRLLRWYYKSYDALFVLNKDHYNWLINKKMEINKASIFITAHWVEPHFRPQKPDKKALFNFSDETPVILFAGRISLEKGVMELPAIFSAAKQQITGLQIVIAGNGPAQPELEVLLPEAKYLGWVNGDKLPLIYSSADILILPSQFDTFSCVVLEALSCGLPVIAYNTKGPKDIIRHGIDGYLVQSQQEIINYLVSFFQTPHLQTSMKKAAVDRAGEYKAGPILDSLMINTGLSE